MLSFTDYECSELSEILFFHLPKVIAYIKYYKNGN